MTKNFDKFGLKSIVSKYDLFFIDIWGVVHNGISLFQSSIDVLIKLEDLNKKYVLLTNAPRPNSAVRKFLENMGLDKKFSEKVYTSGEAALDYLTLDYKEKKFFHIGPPKDFDLFKLFEKNKMDNPDKAEYFLCTGLFDDQYKNLEFYEQLLKNKVKKKMICTNPDLIVDRGKVREYCAGSVAKVFEKIGGKVEYFGKPYSNVYNLSTNIKNKKVLCIGDNLNTDIRGANLQNFSSLFISSGIHRNEFDKNNPEKLFNKYNVTADYFQSNLKW
tara:strand:+ start:153 stop:971 length:819 start_codon:yes stop_codon:yes gene_type:complete